MINSVLLEFLESTEILSKIKDLFSNLCQLQLEIRDLNGYPLQFSPLTNSFKKIKNRKNGFFCNCPKKSCLQISQEIIEKVIDKKEPLAFICEGGYQKILVPIIIKEEILGFLFTGGNSSNRLSSLQIQSILSLLQKLSDYIIKNELRSYDEFQGVNLTHQQLLLSKVIKYIWNNYHLKNLSLLEVAKQNNISYHYLSRLFKKELKTNFAQYRIKVRLNVASKLIKDHSLTISEISHSCGFDDPGYFCKVFKENFGLAPVDFRKKTVFPKGLKAKLKFRALP